MIARIGGDEFVVVMQDIDDEPYCTPMLLRLLQTSAQPIHINEIVLQVSASIGVTYFPQAEEVNADQLLRQADQAMYQAKLSGKNRYHIFDTEHDRTLRGRHENLEYIYLALTNQEFVLYYQPKVNMRTGKVIGAEALIRWQHPERGLLAPSHFLPLIEDLPFAAKLGEWVIATAMAQHEAWIADGLEIPVSVNIGPYQLQQPEFVERLQTILNSHTLVKPGNLQLKVLETSALEDMFQVSKIMHECKIFGVSFALDDFGTGYSTLSYLKYLPAAILKIDRTFVRNMLDDPDDLAILEGILGMSAAFRRRVIAEGVETVEHGELLLKLGCDLAQGYVIAKPMPAVELPAWTTSWKPFPSWTQQQPISRDNLSLIFAAIEHRAWIRMLEEHINGKREQPPALKDNECRFGQWLHGDGMEKYGEKDSFNTLVALHSNVHDMGTRMCGLQSQGQRDEALSGLSELFILRDSLLEQLDTMSK